MNAESRVLVAAAKTVMRGWCRHSSAQDRHGVGISAQSPRAVKHCISGAIERNAGTLYPVAHMAATGQLMRVRDSGDPAFGIVYFNDDVATCKEQVAQLLCEAAGL